MATGTPPGSFYNPDPMVGQEDPALSAPSVDMSPQQQPSGGGIIEQAVATGAVPRSRRRLSAQAPDYGYRMTNEDFYPNQGVQVFRSTPGEYGNIPIPIASPSRVAMAPLAARGQQLRRKQEELDAQVAQLDTLGTGLDKAPPPYQKGMDQLWDAEFTGLVDTWTGAAGSRSAAMRELATPGSEANQQFMRLRRDFNTMTGQGVNTFNKATALRAAVDANQWVSDPKTYEMAKDIEAGMVGISQNNYKRLVSLMEPFEARLSVYEFLNKMGADKSAAIAMQEIQEMPRRSGPYDVQAQHRKLEDFREQLIKQYMAYSGGRIQEKDVREIVEGRYPDSELIQWNRVPQYRDGSGSSGGSDKAPLSYSIGVASAQRPRFDPSMPEQKPQMVIDIFDTTGGKTSQMNKRSFMIEGSQRDLYSPQIQWDDMLSDWVIVGADPSDAEIKTIKDQLRSEGINVDADSAEIDALVQERLSRTRNMRMRRTLVSENRSKLEGYTGYRDPNQMIADKLTSMGQKFTASEVRELMLDPESRAMLMNMFK